MKKFNLHCRWDADRSLDYCSSSLFHGVLMRALKAEYAQYLHQASVAEFHQQLMFEGNQLQWTIYALTDQATRRIEKDWFETVESFYLEQKNLTVTIEKKSASEDVSYLDWYLKHTTQSSYPTKINIRFLSPTSFKSYNRYLQKPSLSLCYRSLVMRLGSLQDTVTFPKKIWNQLAEQTEIIEQTTEKTSFPLEKTKIPAFKDELVLELRGSQEDLAMMNLLWCFAEWAGIGVKTALGMGAVEVTFIED